MSNVFESMSLSFYRSILKDIEDSDDPARKVTEILHEIIEKIDNFSRNLHGRKVKFHCQTYSGLPILGSFTFDSLEEGLDEKTNQS